MLNWFRSHSFWLMPSLIVVLYLATHLPGLTKLPVFADEAIYIRWSQLIIDDWQRYLFFPMNDGKTPLPFWAMVPFQFLVSDQLLAGRLVSVLVGLAQLFAMAWLLKLLGGRTKTQWLGMVMVAVLPFWFFHHRMALTDSWLALWLTLATASCIQLTQTALPLLAKKPTPLPSVIRSLLNVQVATWLGIAGLCIGLAFWSKLPAVLLLPALPFLSLVPKKTSWFQKSVLASLIIGAIGLGIGVFGSLRLHPAFGQLFSRGGDFLYPFSEVLLGGKWQLTLISWPNYIWYFLSYLTFTVLILNLIGPFLVQFKRQQLWLLFAALTFAGPIMLFGIVVFPRYLFPAAIFLTASATLAIQEISDWSHNRARFQVRSSALLVLVLLLANMFGSAGIFISHALTNPDQLPLVSSDQEQYLGEWSSGHGITESVDLIQSLSQDQTLAVATEGYFGTLPDGVLLYFHRQNVDNLMIEGISQPVQSIPEEFVLKAQEFDQAILIVNSHRLLLPRTSSQLLAEYCRPLPDSPCLQVWDISDLVQPSSS